jgi:hypothetical protein
MAETEAGDPLVADLRAVEKWPRDTRADREILWAQLQVLPTLVSVSPDPSTPDDGCRQIEDLLRQAVGKLTDPDFREAATILMRLDGGSATIPVSRLYVLAAEIFPGRRPKRASNELPKDEDEPQDSFTETDPTRAPRMKPDSFTRKGARRDEILDALAYVIRTMEDAHSPAALGVLEEVDIAMDRSVLGVEPNGSGAGSDIRAQHHDLSLSITTCRLEGRQPVERLYTDLVRAARDGVDTIRLIYPPAQRDLEVVYGGIAEYERTGGGYARAIIKLADPPMKLGETRLLVTRNHYVDSPEPPTSIRHAPGRTPVGLLIMCVQFSADAIPARVWWWDETSSLLSPTLFTPDKRLVPNNLYYVEKHFTNTAAYLTCGIAWAWD